MRRAKRGDVGVHMCEQRCVFRRQRILIQLQLIVCVDDRREQVPKFQVTRFRGEGLSD
jgi:hypothetical protein